ncbi:UDP-N-acetylglucosamine 1-carboxyvinyltransferase [Clostridium sp. AM42-4]|uniref:UDP-N-acetylglucosamine 1-carboxyvinyltransferase n=1 Tax=Clostridium sp. AM42-4 TaxID=2292305 RepID=UPI000E52EA56|nr:UDP-N-acetylglucosamine 1-carboxyvinyltransferase [Clostridium sp. AM42-4]RHS88905.1 UDP-N-acetylglucosamine 1-carboxyvinyltransferase [Clostridium sp. AM42-4]
MSVLRIEGLHSLDGTIKIQGSKNGVLPVMAASLLHNGTTVLEHIPKIQDVFCMLGILNALGAECRMEEERLIISAGSIDNTKIPAELAGQMRSSVMLLGPLLARFGMAKSSLPGGCRIGKRPVDLHIRGLEALGATVLIKDDELSVQCPGKGLTGTRIQLPYPSVGATENILMAAAGAEGETVLQGAAREPEIVILCDFLNALGVPVEGAGTPVIRLKGKQSLHDTVFALPGDRIVAGTYVGAVLCAGGSVFLEHAPLDHMGKTLWAAKQMGARLSPVENGIWVVCKERPRPVKLETGPYPEFPTDMQSVMLAAACLADGTSYIRENVFESRFCTAKELQKLGAHIIIEDKLAVVCGVPLLRGAQAEAADLRGGAALVVACLAAEGESLVSGYGHISRGYEDISRDLAAVGARISLV